MGNASIKVTPKLRNLLELNGFSPRRRRVNQL